ncbi:phasin family protein [Undibacterium jejuense]|uniref:Phasin family protein n=1 Tax=Undibacterium jejuense TaxID=1344949 RepID=A0A923HGF4_9BURK|nr:phasin family protein [Undibacterium jejuense]MBC3863274.1 phasin family protein [Undibacterium jejuense]
MPLIHHQISAATQDQIEKQLATIQAFSSTAFSGLEKVIALNFATARQAFERVSSKTEQAFSANASHELLAHAHAIPEIEHLLAYGRELATISSTLREELLHLVGNTQTFSAPPVTIVVETKTVTLPRVEKAEIIDITPAPKKEITEVKEITKKATIKATAKSPANTQLNLLTEPEVKKLAKPVVKAAAKPATKKVSKPANKTNAKATAETKPALATSVKPSPKNVNKTTEKPVVATKSTAVASEPKQESEKVKVTSTTPKSNASASQTKSVPDTAAEVSNKPVVEKKSAVKFPAALTQNLQADKPGFPQAGGRPAFKAKTSPATGAKKRVRQ